jgi:hypothetical protein
MIYKETVLFANTSKVWMNKSKHGFKAKKNQITKPD